ncbi:pyridoxal phosphate enzyme, YggS family [Haemophilus pittmaniae HK 85]|uniref:Pyridoxal phosphate homeostasis protein n=1 Tax=Haemophilus pittmaniae HK 85 TaxID=1035188 RepID=F9QBD0_9PAST|nr:YggS family pyridoxal phosphate-dependent enzyme [Haemophilus pittmaniae]EGV05147.1 pyridoxal phosphate enzyme, YggS family [Haemophilus pittmaniae HK 85]SNV89383.1 succinyl-diaminopimelate desuccinylase [Haemophilus pittmaniae]
MTISQALTHIKQQIQNAAEQSDRKIDEIRLLAVSKTKPNDAIFEAYQAGQLAFGENYVQEGVDKIRYFEAQNIQLEWHFIGPLQSNKTRLVAEHFDWMQTLERAKIADRLNEQRPQEKPPLNVLIQINISDEASKSGIAPPDMLPLAEHICQLPHLRLRGLMAIPAPTNVLTEQQNAFTQMARLFDKLKAAFPNQQIDTLSMGMTDDMQSAIQCGSTMVRIGTAIFGARDYHKA